MDRIESGRGNSAIRGQNRLQVVPLTTNTDRVYRWEALVHLNGAAHKALADQIRTVAKERLTGFVGALPPTDLLAVERAIRIQLGLR